MEGRSGKRGVEDIRSDIIPCIILADIQCTLIGLYTSIRCVLYVMHCAADAFHVLNFHPIFCTAIICIVV